MEVIGVTRRSNGRFLGFLACCRSGRVIVGLDCQRGDITIEVSGAKRRSSSGRRIHIRGSIWTFDSSLYWAGTGVVLPVQWFWDSAIALTYCLRHSENSKHYDHI